MNRIIELKAGLLRVRVRVCTHATRNLLAGDQVDMNARASEKSKLSSPRVSEGAARMLHRSSGVRGCVELLGHLRTEIGLVGGPTALVREGDTFAIDAEKGALDLLVDESRLESRRKAWTSPANPYQSGVLRKYADQVGPARKSAVTYAGGKAEVVCYADI